MTIYGDACLPRALEEIAAPEEIQRSSFRAPHSTAAAAAPAVSVGRRTTRSGGSPMGGAVGFRGSADAPSRPSLNTAPWRGLFGPMIVPAAGERAASLGRGGRMPVLLRDKQDASLPEPMPVVFHNSLRSFTVSSVAGTNQPLDSGELPLLMGGTLAAVPLPASLRGEG